MEDLSLADRLVLARRWARLSQTEAAARAGISRKRLIGYEAGRPVPSDVLMRLGDLYEVSVEWLVKGTVLVPRIDSGDSPTARKISSALGRTPAGTFGLPRAAALP
ncbi:MAG TPA: helix-turn-helix transcriptional regulator [Actinomycetota bacterium]|nr:helix-turn-helix transcriptional regulator [Actinomycetota bacterium]